MTFLARFRKKREASVTEPSAPHVSGSIVSVCRTHVGTVRTLNEDRVLERPDLQLWAIADGMGGHHGGDLAAQTVVDRLSTAEPRTSSDVQAAIELANADLRALGGSTGLTGSTVTVVLFHETAFECLWAGDSELWLARDGKVQKLTRDHSLVEELVASGMLRRQEVGTHPYKHVVTRAVGATDEIVLDSIMGELSHGDVLLLCSDGLTNAITTQGLHPLLTGCSLQDIADQLMAAAITAGAKDNVSFVLLQLGP